MARHVLVGEEQHPIRAGFGQRWYATIDVSESAGQWYWTLVDTNGRYVGSASTPFATEDEAKQDAVNTFNGLFWE
ncbi:hypothetical protein BurMR1_1886 [Burkholderia sp. MR1]|nr:hypothetical protein BurMR1_1886 [Burkholderia sp. MR1]